MSEIRIRLKRATARSSAIQEAVSSLGVASEFKVQHSNTRKMQIYTSARMHAHAHACTQDPILRVCLKDGVFVDIEISPDYPAEHAVLVVQDVQVHSLARIACTCTCTQPAHHMHMHTHTHTHLLPPSALPHPQCPAESSARVAEVKETVNGNPSNWSSIKSVVEALVASVAPSTSTA